MQTIISRSLIQKAIPFQKVKNNIYDLRWGIQSTGLVEETGEEYCTYQLCRYVGELSPTKFVDEIIPLMTREAKLTELNTILIELGASEEFRINTLRNYLLYRISEYDKSKAVNSFIIDEQEVWLDKATRVGLKLRFESELAQGMTDTVLWQDGMQFPLPLENAIGMLYVIEVYASACYDNTQMHLSKVNNLTTLEKLLTYDYKVGYPEKLSL